MGDVEASSDERPQWGSVLQEKFVNAHRIACCPTMDLIAILTHDRQLLVHRTVSWQRILHIKPSEVYFTMESMVWSPDGMRLAVGCDEGEVVVFAMASASEGSKCGVELKPHSSDHDSLHHDTRITAMHWVLMREQNPIPPPPSEILRLRHDAFTPVPAVAGEATKAVSEGTNALVTVDSRGRIGVWWNGLVLVAMVSLSDQLNALSPPLSTTVASVMLASDLSSLFLDVSLQFENEVTQHEIVRLDLRGSIGAVRNHLHIISRVGFEVKVVFDSLKSSLRQIASEWKNAVRVFELKMSLIGSLYEKYGYEEPPQVDMLAIVASGITPPGLAQYFAQDIQEMSVIRMQKMFFTGCDTIQRLIDAKIKVGLQRVLLEVAELRGAVRWNYMIFEQTLGFATNELDNTIDSASLLLAEMETLSQTMSNTRQDYALLFSWLIERIRIHSNDTASVRSGGTSATSTEFEGAGARSLLNSRRLVKFFTSAAESARDFKSKQRNKYQVDVSFGNPVSKRLASSQYVDEITAMESRWNQIMGRMVDSLSKSARTSSPFRLVVPENTCVALHTRWMEVDSTSIASGDEDMGDDIGANVIDAVDWDSLHSIQGEGQDYKKFSSTVIAIVNQNRIFLATAREEDSSIWRAASIAAPSSDHNDAPSSSVTRLALYGGLNSGKREHLVVWSREAKDSVRNRLDVIDYDSIVQWTSVHEAELCLSTLQEILPDVAPKSAIAASKSRTSRADGASLDASTSLLETQAARGIICVVSDGRFLSVYDAEEIPEEESNRDESDDNDEADL